MKTSTVSRLLAIALLAVGAQANAGLVYFASPLTAEVAGATGSGTVLLTYDDLARTLGIDATWSGLSGTTTVAHIHCCVTTPGTGTAPVAVTPGTLPGFPGGASGVSSGSYSTVIDLKSTASFTAGFLTLGGGTAAGAEAFLLANLTAGRAYFNIHSNRFPGGEIRGFPVRVPEPATLGMMGLALAGALTASRRRLLVKAA
jgi:CHRD domain/PEP-CTERM motif